MKRFIIILFIFIVFTPKAFGADFSFGFPKEIIENKVFTVGVLLDTKKIEINSTEAQINFDTEKLEFLGFTDGGIINLWIESPKETKPGEITFSGIIPGGVTGTYDPTHGELQKLKLVYLLFKAKKGGDASFDFLATKALKNDGLGTPLETVNLSSSISINKTVNDQGLEVETGKTVFDEIPPEDFEIYFNEANPNAGTPDLVIFSAEDLGSGIQKYEMRRAGEWHEVTSPLPVSRSFFERKITIRAVDFAGNVRDSEVTIPGDISFLAFIILLLIITVGFYATKLVKYRHGKKP